MNERNNIRLILMLLAVLLLAGCVSSELIQDPDTERVEGDGRITFREKVGNLTRAENMEDRGHYEFGVWAFKGATPDVQIPGGDVMTDFLVAYGSNSHYTALSDLAETFGGDHGGPDYTVPGDGISSWFYQGLGNNPGRYKQSGGNSIQPGLTEQVLKYWDKSAAYHNFFAYAPYYGHQAGVASSALLSKSGGKNVLTYDKLSTFYTDPVEQVSSAAQEFAGTYAFSTRDNYNNEIINANEGLYAAQSVAKANYGQDVPLTFKHLNAKIKVAFYEQIPGYKVELLDLVPAAEATAIYNATGKASSLTGEKNLIPATGAYEGIALSPATKTQADAKVSEHEVVKAGSPLPSYYTQAKTIATDVHATETNDATITMGAGASEYACGNANLRFQKAASNTALLSYGGSPYTTISETSGTGASVLNTTYYTLPNWDPTLNSGLGGYMTQYYTADYTTQHVAQNTGYTLHVSYKLVPEDGSDPDIVYDARVWVAPEYCHWQAGKQYTYVFKITQYTNGTTDPYVTSHKMFHDGDTTDPYVDPDDPRVPSDMALIPIIFDNVFVSDYEKHPDIDAALENVLHWKTIEYNHVNYKFCPVLMKGTEFTSALTPGSGTYHALDHATIPDATGFDGSTRKFSIGADMQFFADTKETEFLSGSSIYASATFPIAGSATAFKDENDRDISDLVKPAWDATYGSGTISLPKYSMYIWSANDATTAEKYTATPLASAVTVKPNIRVMQTTYTYSFCYKRVTKNYVLGTTDTKYYKTDHTEITESTFDTLKGTSPEPTPTYDYVFGYSYEVESTGYGLSHDPASPLPAQAYGLVK